MAYKGNSIVDYLKQSGKDSSYAARKKLAEQNGISGYTGTASQNTQLLNSLRNGGGSGANGQAIITPVDQPEPPKAIITPVTDPNASSTSHSYSGSSSISGPGSSGGAGSRPRREAYSPSDRVSDYYDKVQDLEANEPGAFKSQYSDQIDSILNGILNREEFEYNLNEDKLYEYYRDAYMRQGQKAMKDTIGAASALSGGYGSSYAQTVGSQAYDQYLAGLNDKVPELYQLAYQKYLNEGAEMYNQLGAMQNLDNIDYSRYRDEVNDYFVNRDYYNNRYNQEYGYDYGAYQDALAQMNWEDQFNYQQSQDALAQQNWKEQFEYQKAQDALAQQNWQAEFDYRKQQDALNMALKRARAAGGGRSKGKSEKENESRYRGTSGKYAANGVANLSARDAILMNGSGGQNMAKSGSGLTELIYPEYVHELQDYMAGTDEDGKPHSRAEADKHLFDLGIIDPELRKEIIRAAK